MIEVLTERFGNIKIGFSHFRHDIDADGKRVKPKRGKKTFTRCYIQVPKKRYDSPETPLKLDDYDIYVGDAFLKTGEIFKKFIGSPWALLRAIGNIPQLDKKSYDSILRAYILRGVDSKYTDTAIKFAESVSNLLDAKKEKMEVYF